MSQRALLLAVRDLLRKPVGAGTPADGLAFAATECEVMFDGQPPPLAPERFVAIHPGSWSTQPIEGLDELYGIDVTVTVRVGKVPQDRMGVNALVGPTGKSLDELLEAIRAKLNRNYPVNDLANTGQPYSIGNAANGFCVPLRFVNASNPEPRGPDWFHADAEGRNPPVGLSQTLHFGEAERVQTIESQD